MTDAVANGGTAPPSLAELAATDPLTGLSNSRKFQQRVRDALEAGDTTFAILMLDLDRFKSVNDTLGHPIGDQLLCKVSDRLKTALQPGDLLARLGGDEFAIFCPTADNRPLLERTASRITELLDRPFLIEGHQINIGVSIGISFAGEKGTTYERLMRHADLALYSAKEAGRGTFRYFQQSLADLAQARRELELDIRKALPLRQLEVQYRPRVDVETGRHIGLQAILFWRHPKDGLRPASAFLPLGAQIGLLPKFGKWLLDAACRDAALLGVGLPISVAVHAGQFADREPLVPTVQQALSASGLPPSCLEIEVTEGLLLSQDEAILTALHSLRELGVRIVMNDFGVGYASLTRLTSFPFDGIKIAPSFAVSSEVPANRAIVQAVATLGASLGVTTQIDGVYSRDQLEQLRREGDAPVQGCRLEPAITSSELKALLKLPTGTETLEQVEISA